MGINGIKWTTNEDRKVLVVKDVFGEVRKMTVKEVDVDGQWAINTRDEVVDLEDCEILNEGRWE